MLPGYDRLRGNVFDAQLFGSCGGVGGKQIGDGFDASLGQPLGSLGADARGVDDRARARQPKPQWTLGVFLAIAGRRLCRPTVSLGLLAIDVVAGDSSTAWRIWNRGQRGCSRRASAIQFATRARVRPAPAARCRTPRGLSRYSSIRWNSVSASALASAPAPRTPAPVSNCTSSSVRPGTYTSITTCVCQRSTIELDTPVRSSAAERSSGSTSSNWPIE